MEYRKHTSLKDLAQALGVSIPTVSRALKDSPEISRELCAKAKQLAKDMNYRPNPFAMSLRKNAPRIIGVVVPDIVTPLFCLYPERNREYGNCQRILCNYHNFT